MRILVSLPRALPGVVAAALLSACASTTTMTITPSGQRPVCQPQSALKASVLWRTHWRPDQKDVAQRESAAAQGIADFFSGAKCFPTATIARAESADVKTAVPSGSDLLLVLTVRELGPTLRLLSSPALVEGGTEAIVDVALYVPNESGPSREFTIHWRDGGRGVIKGVQSLPADMAAALNAGLRAP